MSGIFLNFFHTLWIYPVLVFQIKFGFSSYLEYAFISLVFNVGDYLGRYLDTFTRQYNNKYIFHSLLLFKYLLTYYNIYANKATGGIFLSFFFKLIYVLVFAILNGYLIVVYIEMTTANIFSIYDRQRAGYLISYSVGMGLTLGGFVSFLWSN